MRDKAEKDNEGDSRLQVFGNEFGGSCRPVSLRKEPSPTDEAAGARINKLSVLNFLTQH